MCTISVVPDRDGFRLMCNRDESRRRVPALPPSWHRLPRRTALYPVDPLGPGTWVGVNDAGLAVALLNRSPRGVRQPLAAASRGLIVPWLLDELTVKGAIQAARQIDLASFDLFRVVLVEQGSASVLTSNQRVLAEERLDVTRPFMLTSSSLGDDLVNPCRRELFAEMMIGQTTPDWLRGQESFHKHQWPERPELSVRMDRPDARTVSRTSVSVTSDGIRLRYSSFNHEHASIAQVA